MALFEEQITDTLQTGAPSIKYEGDEGPQDPRQEQMLAQLKEEYMQYVFEQKEIDQPIMSFEEWYQSVYEASKMGVQAPEEEMMSEEMMMREPAAYGGMMDLDSGRRAYGLGSIFKKIAKPFKKIAKGAKKVFKSPIGKIGIAALLGGAPMFGSTAGGLTGGKGWFGGGSGIGKLMSKFPGATTAIKEGLFKQKADPNKWSLAKLGIGAASMLPLLGIGTKAKQDQMPEGFSVSGDWDENFKTAGGFPGMRRAIAQSKDKAELDALSEKFGFTPGLFENFAADGGRIGYAGGELVEGITEGIKKIRPGSVDVIEKIKEGIIEGGDRAMGIPGIDEAIWIEKIKDFIRKKRGDPRDPGFNRPAPNWDRDPGFNRPAPPMRPMPDFRRPRRPMRPMPDMPRRQPYALGSKADFAIEDVLTGGMEDEIGGITNVMRTADLQRKGNIGQFYAAEGGRIGAREGGIMDLGGVEKDYRNTGGFVELGAKEKADDVPARLSKNEFVMTADAVRGAGDGDIDKGASIMEDMMKNLEGKDQKENRRMAGPDWFIKRVEHLMFLGYGYEEASDIAADSEAYFEIIGLDSRKQGAEDMFEVSERLSEVV